MVQPNPITAIKISDYPVRKIIRCLMFKNGDVEYPIEECITFVADIVFPHVQMLVQKTIEAAQKRNSQSSPEIIDIIFQFRKNSKLLKRLYEYVSLVNASYRMGKVYNVETNSVNDDNDDLVEDDNITGSSAIAKIVLNSIKKFDTDDKLIDYVTSNVEDASKAERAKRIAARTASMSTEKYQRFADASSYSFLFVGGRRSELFDAGFRYYIKAPEEFTHEMLIILNFCALEMTTVLVESAFLNLLKQSQGITKDLKKLGAIQLEHYKEAAKRIPTKKT
uniref:Uncharacterized protein n=1 Tax=Panagrolaimus sp. PS1159 TaxID=55785 RepID=A0AC35GH66_9BILA